MAITTICEAQCQVPRKQNEVGHYSCLERAPSLGGKAGGREGGQEVRCAGDGDAEVAAVRAQALESAARIQTPAVLFTS